MNVSNINISRMSSIDWNMVLKVVACGSFGVWLGFSVAAIAHALLLVLSILVGKTLATLVVLPLLCIAFYLMPPVCFAATGVIERGVDRFVAKR